MIEDTLRSINSQSTVTPVHEIDVDSSPTTQLLHERRGRDGDGGSAGASGAPHSDNFRGSKCALVGAGGRGGHSVKFQ